MNLVGRSLGEATLDSWMEPESGISSLESSSISSSDDRLGGTTNFFLTLSFGLLFTLYGAFICLGTNTGFFDSSSPNEVGVVLLVAVGMDVFCNRMLKSCMIFPFEDILGDILGGVIILGEGGTTPVGFFCTKGVPVLSRPMAAFLGVDKKLGSLFTAAGRDGELITGNKFKSKKSMYNIHVQVYIVVVQSCTVYSVRTNLVTWRNLRWEGRGPRP